MHRCFRILCLIACCGGALQLRAAESGFVRWNATDNKVDANVAGWTVDKVLGKIKLATGWQILVEPNTGARVSTKFQKAPTGEALKLLLGDLNYALLPEPDGHRKLLVYRTSTQAATENIGLPKDLITNELIVSLNKDSKESIEELAARLGAKILGRADDLSTYRLSFADAATAAKAAATLGNDANVASVDNNYAYHAPDISPSFSGTEGSPFSLKPVSPADGKNTIVGLIDTPVQGLPGEMSKFLLESVHVADSTASESKELTHGPAMAETVLNALWLASRGGGSSARILPVDVYGSSASTTSFEVARGIDAAVSRGAQIVVMSLSGDGDSDFLARAIYSAEQRGSMLVAAAGNQPTGQPVFPAAYPGVIGVTAIDQNGALASYANYGAFVSAAGPGVSIVPFDGQRWVVTGTSSATAFLGGAAAAYAVNGQTAKTADQLRAYLRTAFPVNPSMRK